MPQETVDDRDEWQTPVGNAAVAGRLVEFEPDEVEESPADRIAVMLGSSLQDERAIVKLYRVVTGKPLAWCGDYKPAIFEDGGFEMVRREYGPGDYEIRLYGPGPTNRQVVRARTNITIVPRASDADTPVAQQAMGGEIGRVLQSMQEQQNQLLKVLTDRPDPQAQMMQSLAMLAQVKEVFGAGNSSPGGGMKEMLETIRMLKEVSGEINPPKEDAEPSLMGMLPGVLELVKTGMQQQNGAGIPIGPVHVPQHLMAPIQQRIPEPVYPPNMPQPEPIAAEIPQPQSIDESDPMKMFQMIKLRSLLYTCIQLAQSNAADSQDKAADLLAAELPEELLAMMEIDDWWVQFSAAAKMMGFEVEPIKSWFAGVREKLMEEVDEETPPPQAAT